MAHSNHFSLQLVFEKYYHLIILISEWHIYGWILETTGTTFVLMWGNADLWTILLSKKLLSTSMEMHLPFRFAWFASYYSSDDPWIIWLWNAFQNFSNIRFEKSFFGGCKNIEYLLHMISNQNKRVQMKCMLSWMVPPSLCIIIT